MIGSNALRSIVTSACAAVVCAGAGAQVTVGGTGTGNRFPFNSDYVGQYQQVYSASAFSGPVNIGSIAFESFLGTGAYSFTGTLGLATTSLTPGAPGTTYLTTTQVFSGTQTATLNGNSSAFDLVFNLAAPFTYNPAAGNLLLSVNSTSATAPPPLAAFVFGSSTDVGRTYNLNGNGVPTAGVNEGLLTRFGVSAVTATPEFGSVFSLGGLLAAGGAGLWVNSRRRRAAIKPRP